MTGEREGPGFSLVNSGVSSVPGGQEEERGRAVIHITHCTMPGT